MLYTFCRKRIFSIFFLFLIAVSHRAFIDHGLQITLCFEIFIFKKKWVSELGDLFFRQYIGS